MCALVGMIGYSRLTLDHLLSKSSERGRDGFGSRTKGPLYIANFRAEPTTEYVNHKHPYDQQPYTLGSWTVVHNGTIANDKEIRTYQHPTSIDSAAVVELLAALPTPSYKDEHAIGRQFQSVVERLKGSYAILAYHAEYEAMYVAVNYQALWYARNAHAIFFASSRDFFPRDLVPKMIEPYSTWMFRSGKPSVRLSAAPGLAEPRRALVVASGGLDSTVVAAQLQNEGYKVELLHFLYGSRAQDREVEAVEAIATHMAVPYHLFPIPIYRRDYSPLLCDDSPIAGGEAGAEFAYEWVPARNLVMISLATALAEAWGIETIALGNNIEEAGCVSFDTKLTVRRQANKMHYTIEQLYNLMKGDRAQVKYGMRWDREQDTLIRTMFPDGTVGYNVIEDIVYAGEKPGYRIQLEDGTSVTSSNEHEWFTTEGWQRADALTPGCAIFCNGIPRTPEADLLMRERMSIAKRGDRNPNKIRENADRIRRTLNLQRGTEAFYNEYWRVTGMSFHPNVNANGYISKHRVVIEASLNDTSFDEWVLKCRLGAFTGNEVFLDPALDVHHKDGDVHNNTLENLQVLTHSEHTALHHELDSSRSRRAVQQAHGLSIHPVKVISIVKTPPVKMYDLHVRGTANYAANNMIGHNSYPDNVQEFIARFNDILPFATAVDKRVRIVEPVGNLTKREIVALGTKLEAPISKTWSCYRNGPRHCGTCGPCYMRATAHAINGLKDPVMDWWAALPGAEGAVNADFSHEDLPALPRP
jgi:7-cyano-7-deazaguanine synthase in queuosine biosynthesis